jgi:hypothetical protein
LYFPFFFLGVLLFVYFYVPGRRRCVSLFSSCARAPQALPIENPQSAPPQHPAVRQETGTKKTGKRKYFFSKEKAHIDVVHFG